MGIFTDVDYQKCIFAEQYVLLVIGVINAIIILQFAYR